MKIITKEYKILKDGIDTERTVAFVVPYKTERVNDAFRRLKEDYPEEEGYWLIRIRTSIEDTEK